MNRITSGYSTATTGAFSWGETYTVDPWGNLNIAPMGGKAHGGNFANASDNNNRPLGFTYDAAGNLTNTSQYIYDPENRVQVTAGMGYAYDADGQRVLKSNSSTGAALKRYWMGNGNVLAEGDGAGNLTAEYIYFNGKRIARIDLPANTVHYYLSDHLGSTSKVVNSAGVVEEESDYTAFGSELLGTSGANHYKFTGKERDSETQLDYFGARFYSNLAGRFITPDWAAKATAVPYAEFADPQSLNLYSYAGNDPLSRVDIDGHCAKGFNWLCNLGQRIGNGVTGYGWHTNKQVDDIVAKTQEGLKNVPGAGDIAENLTRKQIYKLGTGKGTKHDGVIDFKIDSKTIISFALAGGTPRSPKNFKKPTNPPQEPPTDIPDGWRVRRGLPTENYPDGYWRLEKPMSDGGWQGIDPSTMKPGGPAETHIPLPPSPPPKP